MKGNWGGGGEAVLEEGDRLRVWTDATDEQDTEANTTLFRRCIRRRRELLNSQTRCFFFFFFNAGQIKLRFFKFFLVVARTVAYMTAISMQRGAVSLACQTKLQVQLAR